MRLLVVVDFQNEQMLRERRIYRFGKRFLAQQERAGGLCIVATDDSSRLVTATERLLVRYSTQTRREEIT